MAFNEKLPLVHMEIAKAVGELNNKINEIEAKFPGFKAFVHTDDQGDLSYIVSYEVLDVDNVPAAEVEELSNGAEITETITTNPPKTKKGKTVTVTLQEAADAGLVTAIEHAPVETN